MPTFEEFKQKHILNPRSNPQYESWHKRDQNNWLRNRLAYFPNNPGQQYGRKNMNSVIIATSSEVLRDFATPGVKYEKEQDFYWSNGKYPVWLFKKKKGESNANAEEGQYSVTKLHERHGPMHFLARTSLHDGYKPIHFHAQSPDPSPTSFPRY